MTVPLTAPVVALSPAEKRELLAQLLREKVEGSQAFCPLSYGQRALWFLHQLAPESWAYHTLFAARVCSEVDIPALQRTFQTLIDRHPALRTTYTLRNGEPVQQIHPHQDVDFEQTSAAAWDEAELNDRLREQIQQPFDLEHGPVVRVRLFSRAAKAHILLLVGHHIALDLLSYMVLLDELRVIYPTQRDRTSVALPPIQFQYTDFVRWQTQMLSSLKGQQLWAYWQEQLGTDLPLLNLPTDRPRPAVQTYRGATHVFSVNETLTQQLQLLAKTEKTTLYAVLLAAFQTLLYRYSAQPDILVGSPMLGRGRPEFERVVGYFVNMVVLRANCGGNPPFKAFLGQVSRALSGALDHQDYPFALLVERLRPQRDSSRSPFLDVMFDYETLQSGQQDITQFFLGEVGRPVDFGGLILEPFPLRQQEGQFDLALHALEAQGALQGALVYNTDLFDVTTMARLAQHFEVLLQGIVTNPETPLSRLPLLTTLEENQLSVVWNHTPAAYPATLCLHQLFETQVERTPNALAIIFPADTSKATNRSEGQTLTYRELSEQANQLAHYLRGLGVGPGTLVGLYLERSLDMVVGLLGTLKAGAAYIPLDPAYPKERLALILEDAPLSVLLTQEQLLDGLPAHTLRVVCVQRDREVLARQSKANPTNLTSGDNLAYILFTSGSTGRPKGVQIPHRAVVNFLSSMRQQPGLTERDTLFSVTTLSFDIAGLELFLPLIVGARVVLASREVVGDGRQLATQLANWGATVMQATPSTWQLLLEAGWSGEHRLKALCGGEACPRELANRLIARCASVWNMYGPTETTIWSTIYAMEAGEGTIPIGRPIANTQIYLLNSDWQPVPVGVPGVLYIGGAGLAWGYLNQPALTAEKFIPNPFSAQPGERLYNTGDLARYRPEGAIEFLGRSDQQVKIRGYRMELGEIEAALCRHPGVKEAVVVAREDGSSAPSPSRQTEKRLVAYIISDREPAPPVSELRRFLQEKLPAYMLPSVFVLLGTLPLTPNGKVNRRALPPPEDLRPELEVAYTAPRSELEQSIARIWQEVLQIDRVGLHDNFFALGGHSLLLARVHLKLQQDLKRDLPLVELFQYVTVHSLAKHLTQIPNSSTFQSSSARVELRQTRRTLVKRQKQRRQANRQDNQ